MSQTCHENCHDVPVAGAVDDWQTGLGISAAVAQCVWGLADVVGDVKSLSNAGDAPSGLIDWIDILCPIVETVLLWPSEANADGGASYPFHGGIATDTKDSGLLPPAIICALVPSALAFAAKVSSRPAPEADPFEKISAFVVMGAGIVNTALSVAYCAANDSGGAAIAGSVLGNVSFVLAPLQTQYLNEASDDVPLLIKTTVDLIGNIGAGVCIAEATSLPPK